MRYEISHKGKRPKLNDPANWMDLSYFFYLPFTNIFISKDNFHIDNIDYFIQTGQLFISGKNMKQELSSLVAYYSAKEKTPSQSLFQLICFPPIEGDFLASELYDQFYPDWREHARNPIEITPELNQAVNSQLNIPYKDPDGTLRKPMVFERNNISEDWLRFEK